MMDIGNLSFVAAQPEDFDYFYALRKQTMLDHFVRAGKGWPEAEELAGHRQIFNIQTLRMIHLDGERIGFINVETRETYVDIGLFCIQPTYQNKSIGQSVMQRILGEPDTRKKIIRINVLHSNPAAHLYERLGFVRTNERHDKLAFYKLVP